MKYVSNRVKDLKVGISNYSEEKFSLDIVGIVTAGSYRTGSSNLHSDGADLKNLNVTGVSTFGGNVAIGTDNVYDPVGASNTTILAVGILTANTIYSTVYGQFTGGSVVANNIVGSALSVSGISSLGSVQISSGIITAVSGIVTYFGDGSNLTGTGSTADIKTNSLQVLGISTFTGDIKANGNIVGDSATNISGISSVTATKFFGALTGDVTGDVTGDLTGTADTAITAATVTGNSQPNITSLGSLTGLNVVGIATVGGDIKANGNIVGDNATNISGINSVTATNFFGNASSSTTATLSLFSFMTNNSTANETVFPVFVDGTTSSEQLEVDSGFTYNPSSGILSATKFLGNLDGTLETAAQPNVTSLGTLTSLSVNGNVSIGGTLTYDDVTNIDSVGLITARQGIHVGAGLSVVGISTFTGNINANGNIVGDNATNISGINSVTATSFFGGLPITDGANNRIITASSASAIQGEAGLTFDGTTLSNLGTGFKEIKIAPSTNNSATLRLQNSQANYTISNITGGSFSIADGSDTRLTINSSGVVGINSGLNVDGHTELDNVNITGFTTFATGTKFFQHTPRIEMQGSNTATLSFVNATSGTTTSDGMLMGFSSSSQVGFINVNESLHGFILKTGGNATGNERINISGLGTVSIRKGTTEEMITARPDGAVELYFNANKKFETTNTGVVVTGIATATTFSGNISGVGATFTNLTGTLQTAAQPNITSVGTLSSLNVSGITSIGEDIIISSGVVTATKFVGDGSGLTGVTASGTGVIIERDGSSVGTAGTINFGDGLSVTNVVGGKVTVTGITTANIKADSLVVSGVTTASAFVGFDYLQAPFGSTVNFTVTVDSKNATHRYNGQGSGQAYIINGVQSPFLTLTPGRTYRFNLSASNQSSHPFRFYLEADKTTEYSTNVTTTATYTEITVTDTTPNVLHYQCSAHVLMGNAVVTNSNVVDTPYVATLRKGLNVTSGVSTFADNINANGNIIGDNATNISGINSVTATSFFGDGSNLTGTSADIPGISTTTNSTFENIIVNGNAGIGSLNVTGVSTFADNIFVGTGATVGFGSTAYFNGKIDANAHTELNTLKVSGISSFVGITTFFNQVYIRENKAAAIGKFSIQNFPDPINIIAALTNHGTNFLLQQNEITIQDTAFNSSNKFFKASSTRTELFHAGSERFVTNGIGATIYGQLDIESQQVAISTNFSVGGISTFTGNINANGNIVGDNATNISGINSVTATSFFGSGSSLTGIDKIEEGNSKVEVTDSGTGHIDVVADNANVARFANVTNHRTYMIIGNSTAVSNNYGNNAGNVIIASNTTGVGGTTTSTLRLFTSGVGMADDTVTGIIDFAAQQSGTGGQTVSKIESSLRGSVENTSDLIFSTSNAGSPTEKLRIRATGNIGIGITNPTSKLHVNGDAKVSGVVTATSFFGDGSNLSGIGVTSGAVTDQTGISTAIGTFNVSAGIATNIDSFAYASNNYKTAEYTLHFMNGSNTQAQKLLVMQDGVTAFSNEFAVMSSSSLLVSVGATVSGSNVLVQATPETGVSGVTTFRWRREVQN